MNTTFHSSRGDEALIKAAGRNIATFLGLNFHRALTIYISIELA
jgi:hypothetical protein